MAAAGEVRVLISHSPPWGVGDTSHTGVRCGSMALREGVEGMARPPGLWVFGHIHECGGRTYRRGGTVMVNASSCPLLGRGVRPPVVVDVMVDTGEVRGVHRYRGAGGERDNHPMDGMFNN